MAIPTQMGRTNLLFSLTRCEQPREKNVEIKEWSHVGRKKTKQHSNDDDDDDIIKLTFITKFTVGKMFLTRLCRSQQSQFNIQVSHPH